MSQETIEQLLERVRDYDQHTSDADIDRLCNELECMISVIRDIKSTLGCFGGMGLRDQAN